MTDIKQSKSKVYDLMRNCRYTEKGLKDFKKSVQKQIQNNIKKTSSLNILKQTNQSAELLKQSYKCLRSFKQRQKSEYINLKSLCLSRIKLTSQSKIKINDSKEKGNFNLLKQIQKKKKKNHKKTTSNICLINFPQIKPKFQVNFKPKNASLSEINLENSMFKKESIQKQTSYSYLNKHYQDLKKKELNILKQITEENVKKFMKLQKRSKYFSVSQNSNY